MEEFERLIMIHRWEGEQVSKGNFPKLHESPQELLTQRERDRVDSFLSRHPEVQEKIQEKEFEKEELEREEQEREEEEMEDNDDYDEGINSPSSPSSPRSPDFPSCTYDKNGWWKVS